MFKCKARLPRGLSLRKVDEEARWLVNNTERYSASHKKIANRLRNKERARQNQMAFDVIVALAIMVSLMSMAPIGYIKFMPTSMIARVVSSQQAMWVDDLRKSGCSESYLRHIFSPFLGGQVSKMWQYKDCQTSRMNFSS